MQLYLVVRSCQTMQQRSHRICYNCFVLVIQDTGISVRKRVIKIFRDICIEQPDFPKIPEMCVKMIRRVNDEEGIRVSCSKLISVHFSSAPALILGGILLL